LKKLFVYTILFLLIGTALFPPALSTPVSGKHIITVDDEPGDADYISIGAALNESQSGDTIEVFSGTYIEQNLAIRQNETRLIGISHELGQGNDTGQPVILGDGNESVLWVKASHVVVSNFRVEMIHPHSWSSVSGMYLGMGEYTLQNHITVSNMTIANCTEGIACNVILDVNITNNDVSHCLDYGIVIGLSFTKDRGVSCVNNSVSACKNGGIVISGKRIYVMDNIVWGCPIGVKNYQGESDYITRNAIKNCNVSVYLNGGYDNSITQNNFINYSKTSRWWDRPQGIFLRIGPRDVWRNNYWDTWLGKGPQPIPGTKELTIWWLLPPYGLTFPIKWLEFDLHPAHQPFTIPP